MRKWPARLSPIVCFRKGDSRRVLIPGAQECHCYCCDAIVMASPATIKLVDAGKDFICIECLQVLIDERKITALPRTSEQAEEVRKYH